MSEAAEPSESRQRNSRTVAFPEPLEHLGDEVEPASRPASRPDRKLQRRAGTVGFIEHLEVLDAGDVDLHSAQKWKSLRKTLTASSFASALMQSSATKRRASSSSCPTSPRNAVVDMSAWGVSTKKEEDASATASSCSDAESCDGLSNAGAAEEAPEPPASTTSAGKRQIGVMADPFASRVAGRKSVPASIASPSSHGCLTPMNGSRAHGILRNIKFYKEMDSRLKEKVISIANVATFPAGTVLFRQGDSPANCYVILSGEISVLIMDEQTEDPSPTAGAAILTRFSAKGGDLPQRSASLSCTEASDLRCQPTFEGFSWYRENSSLGREVARLKPGTLLGEVALLNDDKRTASTKCLEECECLVITKMEFDKVMKEELNRAKAEKLAFLREHLPGMREVHATKGKPHASYFFRHETFPKGHVFLRQGMPSEETYYAVVQGSVEFRRSEPSSCSTPANSRPGTPTNSRPGTPSQFGVRPNTPSRFVRLCEEGGRQPQQHHHPAAHRAGSRGGHQQDVNRKIAVLMPGGVFGSLPTAGEPEPFTVAAVSNHVEVFYIGGDAIAKLPRRLLEVLRDHLMRMTTWRLEKLRCNRAADERRMEAWVQPPRGRSLSKSESDGVLLPTCAPNAAPRSTSAPRSSPSPARSAKRPQPTRWAALSAAGRAKEAEKGQGRRPQASTIEIEEVVLQGKLNVTVCVDHRPTSAGKVTRSACPTNSSVPRHRGAIGLRY